MKKDSSLARAASAGLALCLMTASAAAQAGIGQAMGAPPPPRPAHPNLDNLTPDQADALMQAYRAALRKWENGFEREARMLADEARLKRDQGSAVPMGPDYSWRAEAEALGFRPATLAQLERDSIAIAGPSYKQSFEVYTANALPPFVTSDSLLNAFHVLFEDSVRRFELTRVPALREALVQPWKGLDGRLARNHVSRSEIEPFARHLAYVIGPALRLLGSNVPLGGAEVEETVAAEVKKIEAADEVSLPPWLGPPDRSLLAIDYRRCRSIGFYAFDPALARYYAAVRWLQSIPFRSSRTTEVGAAALLACLARPDAPEFSSDSDLSQFVSTGTAIFGRPDEPSVESLFDTAFLVRIGRDHQSLPDEIARFRAMMAAAKAVLPPSLASSLASRPQTVSSPGKPPFGSCRRPCFRIRSGSRRSIVGAGDRRCRPERKWAHGWVPRWRQRKQLSAKGRALRLWRGPRSRLDAAITTCSNRSPACIMGRCRPFLSRRTPPPRTSCAARRGSASRSRPPCPDGRSFVTPGSCRPSSMSFISGLRSGPPASSNPTRNSFGGWEEWPASSWTG